MCGGKAPKAPPPAPAPAPPPPPPAPVADVQEVGKARRTEDEALGREARSETRRVDKASTNVVGDGSGLKL